MFKGYLDKEDKWYWEPEPMNTTYVQILDKEPVALYHNEVQLEQPSTDMQAYDLSLTSPPTVNSFLNIGYTDDLPRRIQRLQRVTYAANFGLNELPNSGMLEVTVDLGILKPFFKNFLSEGVSAYSLQIRPSKVITLLGVAYFRAYPIGQPYNRWLFKLYQMVTMTSVPDIDYFVVELKLVFNSEFLGQATEELRHRLTFSVNLIKSKAEVDTSSERLNSYPPLTVSQQIGECLNEC